MEYQPNIKHITGAGGVIAQVARGSIAADIGLQAGDSVIAIGDQRLRDVIDYRFAVAEAQIELHVRTAGGDDLIIEIEKDEADDLGIEFSEPLFDRLRTCNNKCPFCFLTQMPRGMRKTLYLKDDDYRLSFLYGNFVTFTNLSEADWQRIAEQRLGPMNISVHATDPTWRAVMLGKRELPDVREQIARLGNLGISVHTQVVACPGANDGSVLQQTIEDLAALYPIVQSISIVPVGLTKFRFEGKAPKSIRAAIEVHETPDWIDTNWERQPLWEEQSTEQRAQSREQRAESRERRGHRAQRAESTEHRAQSAEHASVRAQHAAPHQRSLIPLEEHAAPQLAQPAVGSPQPLHDPELGFCSRLGATTDIPLRCYTPAEAGALLDLVQPYAERFQREHGFTLVYPSDEFYILAERETPPAAWYDDMPQYSNGVGMVRDFLDGWAKARKRLPATMTQPLRLALVCGTLVAPMMEQVASRLNRIEGLHVSVVPVVNSFFGETVTVSGLLTAQDVIPALRASGCERAILPRVMFDHSAERTIDDYSVQRIGEEAGMPVAVANDPEELVRYVRGLARSGEHRAQNLEPRT
jgi:NifB/MoaA-like Fe-S oxidoreductase